MLKLYELEYFKIEKEFSWKNTEWNYSGSIGPCSRNEESGTCIQSTLSAFQLVHGGEARLKVKIDLSELKGRNKKIRLVSCKGKVVKSWWTGIYKGGIEIYGDGSIIFSSEISYGDNAFQLNEWKDLDIDIDGYSELDVKIYHWAKTYTGAIEMHTARVKLVIDYETEEPPSSYSVTVRVIDMDTDNPISDCLVRLKQGDSVKYSDKTDKDGTVTFDRVYEGGYTILAIHPSYYDAESPINVCDNLFVTVKMERKPTVIDEVIAWFKENWWWIAGIGGILIGVTVIPEVIKAVFSEFGKAVKGGITALREGVRSLFKGGEKE